MILLESLESRSLGIQELKSILTSINGVPKKVVIKWN